MSRPGHSADLITAGLGALLAGALPTLFWTARSGAEQTNDVPEVASHDTPNSALRVLHSEVVVKWWCATPREGP
jgi:hypothetical protein